MTTLKKVWPTNEPNVDSALDSMRKDVSSRVTTIVDGFSVDNIAASTGATLLNRDGLAAAWGPTKWLAPRAGYVAGIFVGVSAVLTAGSLTIALFKNGSAANMSIVYPVTTKLFTGKRFKPEAGRFSAGDYLELKYSTDAGLLPTGSVDIMAGLEIVLE